MRCREVQKQFSRYRDQRLSVEEKQKVKEHLLGCVRCAREQEVYTWALTPLRRPEKEKVPEAAWTAFRSRLQEEKTGGAWWREEVQSLRLWGASAVAVATLLLLFNWTLVRQQEQQIAAQNFLTNSQFGKVLVVF